MNSRRLTWIVMFIVILIPTASQLSAQQPASYPHYKVIHLGTFGGPNSYLSFDSSYRQVSNNQGLLTGWADIPTPDPFPSFCIDPDCFVARAFQWHNGIRIRLSGLATGPIRREVLTDYAGHQEEL